MNDIKKKEKAYELQKISLIGPQLTNFILFLMVLLPGKFKFFYMSDSMSCLILLAIFSNAVTVSYFINQLKKYDVKENEDKKFMIMKNLFAILISIVCIALCLYKK